MEKSNKAPLKITTKLCLLLGVLSFLLYANTLQDGYVMDDGLVLTKNKLVGEGIRAIPALLTTAHLSGYRNISGDTYRPLSLVMFAIEKECFGFNPTIGHLINILFFSGCVVLLFLFFDKLFERKRTPGCLIAVLLFAAHPIHTEVVANIKSRDELLCFFFAFWSLNIFLDYAAQGKIIKLLGGALLLFLAFLSKETVITFVVIVPLIFFFYRNENKRRSVYISISTVVVALAFIGIRGWILKGHYLPDITPIGFLDNQLVNVPESASRLATELLALGYYIKLLFAPWPLLCNYAYSTIPFAGFSNVWALLSLALYFLLFVFGVYRLIKVKQDPWAFGILFFVVTLSLFSNIVFLTGAIVAERFTFFASAGFCLLVALAIEKWIVKVKHTTIAGLDITALRTPKLLFLFIPLLLLYGGMTIARNNDWKSNYTLFSSDVKNAPDNSKLLSDAGNELISSLKNKDLSREEKTNVARQAINYLENALTVYEGNADAHAGLMKLFVLEKMFDSAQLHEQRAVELAPNDVDILNNAAGFFFHTKQYRQALLLYKKNLIIDTNDAGDYGNIGLCYYYLQSYDSSVMNLKKALMRSPESKEPNAQLALVYKAMGNMDSALKYTEIVRQYRPGFRLR